MQIQRKILIKWTLITAFCGGHSFFWGLMAGGEITAMVAGMISLILMFSWIDSHPRYQSHRTSNPLFARAMDLGVKIRLFFAAYIVLSSSLFLIRRAPDFTFFLLYPLIGELWIGSGADMACLWVTGTNLERSRDHNYPHAHNFFQQFVSTYVTTIITGLMHTIILALICGIVYLFLRWKTYTQK